MVRVSLLTQQLQLTGRRISSPENSAPDCGHHGDDNDDENQRDQQKCGQERQKSHRRFPPSLLRHRGQRFLPLPGSEGLEDRRLGSDSGLGAEHFHQEVGGGREVGEGQPGAGAGDVPHHGHQLGVPDLKQILAARLEAAAAAAVHGEGGECLVVGVTLEHHRLLGEV